MSMEDTNLSLKVIAYIRTDFPEKFGIPRQSGLAATRGEIIFEQEYRHPEVLRGLEAYSYIWLIWGFSKVVQKGWAPTVRPPRLGGNRRMGVFATRSPFRPNPLGLSCVKLERIEERKGEGYVLHVRGADLMDGTPIYDIKPYLPYVDCHDDAAGGFTEQVKDYSLQVEIPDKWAEAIPEEHREALMQILAQDPRPSYQEDPQRIYGMGYAGMNIRFQVRGRVLTVCGVYECADRTASLPIRPSAALDFLSVDTATPSKQP